MKNDKADTRSNDEAGESMVEYTMIVAAVSAVTVVAVTALSEKILALPGWNLFA